MPRPIFVLVAALIAALMLLGAASCSMSAPSPPPPPPPPPPPTQVCPDGTVILASDGCPLPPPPPPPPPPPRPAERNGDEPGHAVPPPPAMANGQASAPGQPRTPVRGPARAEAAESPDFAAEGPPAPDPVAAPVARPPRGLGAFVEPGDMEVDNWYPLRFLVARDRQTLEAESEGQALAPSQVIYVGETMRVVLPARDPNFTIERQSPEVVALGYDGAGSWEWRVKPLRGGTHTLSARVEILQRGPDGKLVRLADGSLKVLDDYTRTVRINVEVGTWRGFMNALRNAADAGDLLGTLFLSWEKTLIALTALIAAFGGLLLAIRKLRPAKAQGS